MQGKPSRAGSISRVQAEGKIKRMKRRLAKAFPVAILRRRCAGRPSMLDARSLLVPWNARIKEECGLLLGLPAVLVMALLPGSIRRLGSACCRPVRSLCSPWRPPVASSAQTPSSPSCKFKEEDICMAGKNETIWPAGRPWRKTLRARPILAHG